MPSSRRLCSDVVHALESKNKRDEDRLDPSTPSPVRREDEIAMFLCRACDEFPVKLGAGLLEFHPRPVRAAIVRGDAHPRAADIRVGGVQSL